MVFQVSKVPELMKPRLTQPLLSWRVVAASAAGKRHVQQKQPCQDAVRWQAEADGWLFAAVADGAGSAKLGELGAATAATAALAALRQQFASTGVPRDATLAEAGLREVLRAARAAVVTEATQRGAALGDLATTLVCGVAGPAWAGAAQIGDGAVVFSDNAGQLRALTKPLAGEYLNETVFLTSENMLERAQFQTWSGGLRHLALFSDGLQMLALKMPEGTPHAPFFRPLFTWLGRVADPDAARPELLAWLASPRVTDRTDDDLTLLLAGRVD
jgi:hypothetical protein